MEAAVVLILIVLAILALALSIKIIPQQQMGVVERLGKFNRVIGPGLNFLIPILERVAGKESIRIRQLDVPVETKTKDNVFVNLGVSVQFLAVSEKIFEAFYRLTDVNGQITSYVFDVLKNGLPPNIFASVKYIQKDLRTFLISGALPIFNSFAALSKALSVLLSILVCPSLESPPSLTIIDLLLTTSLKGTPLKPSFPLFAFFLVSAAFAFDSGVAILCSPCISEKIDLKSWTILITILQC